MRDNVIRSPFFYVGDKYKLVPQLKKLVPARISMYIEPFVGGGSSLLNATADTYWANDVDSNVIRLHKFLAGYAHTPDALFKELFSIIDHYSLSCSYKGICAPDCFKKQYPKTYYSHYNKEGYLRMRNDFNTDSGNYLLLYLLLIYGFNHMIRYNASGVFNLPVGNVDFNKNVYNALASYLYFLRNHEVVWFETDYADFLNRLSFVPDAYVFCDPPYLISNSEYNKLWNYEKEIQFYSFLDQIDCKGVKFGLTNLAFHKGQKNPFFIEWAKKYSIYSLKSNYISFNDNSIKTDSLEFFVTNCRVETPAFSTISLVDLNNIEDYYRSKTAALNNNNQPDLFDVVP